MVRAWEHRYYIGTGMLSCWSLELLFLSLASIITSSNVTFEFNISHNCQYAINVTFYTIKQEIGKGQVGQVLYSCKLCITVQTVHLDLR